jgi:hypothetical protein
MDADLEEKLERTFEYIDESQFDRIFNTNTVFSQKDPCTYLYDDKPDKKVYNHNLRKILDRLPKYFSSVNKKNIMQDTAVDILCTMLADPNNYEGMALSNSNPVGALTQTIARLPKNHSWNEESSRIIELITLANENSLHGNAVMSLGHAQDIGLSISQAKKIIDIPSHADGSIAGYYMPYLLQAFSTLHLTKPDPNLVVDVFKELLGERPYYQNKLASFSKLTTFGFPQSDLTIDEYLGLILSKNTSKLGSATKIIDVNNYFIEKDGCLDFVSLPYQMHRPLEKGIADLRKLYGNKTTEWERVDEGFWAYNPKTQNWFSFGGETKIESGRVRHEMLPVNLELLGEELYLFHLHPDAYRCMVAPSRHDISNPLNATILGDFILGTPSRADYALLDELKGPGVTTRAFIVHKRGITEYSAQGDDSTYLSKESRNIRDEVLQSVENQELYLPYPPDNHGFRKLMHNLNERLPYTAQLKWYDSENSFLNQNNSLQF